MMEMRELTRLFIRFRDLSSKEVEVESMYERVNLTVLTDAMNQMCENEDGKTEKHGLKINSVFQ